MSYILHTVNYFALIVKQNPWNQFLQLFSLFRTFNSAMNIVDNIDQSDSLLGSCVDFLEAWLNLAEKLANSREILHSPHGIPLAPPSHPDEEQPMFHPLFNPLKFVVQAQQV